MGDISWRTFLRFFRVLALTGIVVQTATARVMEEGQNTVLIDRTGERWDITQARAIGFDPRGFEFGIGRNAFRPLSDADWHPAPDSVGSTMPVIGVAGDGHSHAYSVRKLAYHETANTMLGSKAILVGY